MMIITGAQSPRYYHSYLNTNTTTKEFIFQKEGINMEPKEVSKVVIYTPKDDEKFFME